jgi:GST-like protein
VPPLVAKPQHQGQHGPVLAHKILYVWTWDKANGGQFANINRPIAGPPTTRNCRWAVIPLQLYSLATPNGVKVTVMLEELLALGHTGAEYDAWLIRINQGDQFGSGFVASTPTPRSPR